MQSSVGNLASLLQSVLIKNGFVGEFHVDKPTRLLNATDNSIYEVMPAAVAIPATFADLQKLISLSNQEPFKALHFCARGGGTGTNGQSLTDGIVIDFSKFMNRIVEFNPEEMSVIVEPGVILDDLNRFLQPHGLFFAPNVSTSNRATIGGMIATDAAGKGSLIYGKTADHVLGLKVLLPDGTLLNTIEDKKSDPAFNSLTEKITDLLTPLQDEITARFPPLKRPLSGYNIRQCYQNSKFDLNYLIAGSEGTLGVVGLAKLKLLPIPKFKTLMVVHYPSFVEALRDANFLIQFSPLAIEAIDEKVQKSAQTLPNWPQLAKMLNSEGKNYISNFVEFVADSKEELAAKTSKIIAALDEKQANYVVIEDNTQIAQLWSIRSLAVGLAGKMPGKRKPVAFVEDAIVPPEHLADFVADLEHELNQLKLNYAMYGHVDVGCIHVRPALDMQNSEDREEIRPITELVIKLLNKYQGILWGEHGKGYRGEFVPDVFGPVLYPVLCKIKKLFDPENRFNPGKLTSPDEKPLIRIESVSMRGEFDQHIPLTTQEQFTSAMICNGNGACFNKEPNNVMCPSYKITKDRIHSPKGRAMLVKEWLRKKSSSTASDIQTKLAADEAYAALSGCLGCKGCSGKCPTQVSIPDLRTTFLNDYHKHYKKRKLRDYLLGHIEGILPTAYKLRGLWKLANRTGIAKKLGIINSPEPANLSFEDIARKHSLKYYTDANQSTKLETNAVIIFTDSFTGMIDTQILLSSVEFIKKAGYIPYLTEPQTSGKALIVAGYIDKFKANAERLAKLFNPLFALNIPIVSLENTIALMFRDEVRKFATSFAGKVLTLAELAELLTKDKVTEAMADIGKYRLLPHCTEQALAPAEAILWQKAYAKVGINLEVKNLGCCGMAGTYGHLAENANNSSGLFELNWKKTVTDDNVTTLASGFSCRCQADKLAAIKLKHPIEVLNNLIGDFKG